MPASMFSESSIPERVRECECEKDLRETTESEHDTRFDCFPCGLVCPYCGAPRDKLVRNGTRERVFRRVDGGLVTQTKGTGRGIAFDVAKLLAFGAQGGFIGVFTLFRPRLKGNGVVFGLIASFLTTTICEWAFAQPVPWTYTVLLASSASLIACLAASLPLPRKP